MYYISVHLKYLFNIHRITQSRILYPAILLEKGKIVKIVSSNYCSTDEQITIPFSYEYGI